MQTLDIVVTSGEKLRFNFSTNLEFMYIHGLFNKTLTFKGTDGHDENLEEVTVAINTKIMDTASKISDVILWDENGTLLSLRNTGFIGFEYRVIKPTTGTVLHEMSALL